MHDADQTPPDALHTSTEDSALQDGAVETPRKSIRAISSLPWTLASEAPIWRDRLIVLGVTMLVLLPFLGSFGLWDPWETHYGEVGRQITERNDWISTWWGSHWKNASGGSEGTFFFSKPIFLMWIMALGLEVFGFSEWGIRLGVCMISITAVVMAYSMGQRIWNRRVGYLFALILCTSPFFFFLSRQAQTDMPFVGNMTIALCFFMMAIFGKHRERAPTKRSLVFMTILTLTATIPQLVIVATGLSKWRSANHISFLKALFYWGPFQVGLYALILILIGVSIARSKKLTERTLLLAGFYIFTGFASISKGLLGFALPGAFIFFFLLLTGHWRRLKEMELARGIPLFITVAFPWYVGMLVRHGNAFYQRFFIHDHFKRLATGVHQIDSGSFEHYIKWMFYGLWPWGSFLPAAFARLFTSTTAIVPPPANDSTDIDPEPSDRDTHHATLFLLIWLTFTFSLFTLASTKFHHYIFPAIPAAAFLVALTISDLVAQRKAKHTRPVAFILLFSALSFFALIAWDIFDDPQHLKNLFSYKYDRKWNPTWTTSLRPYILAIILTAAPGMVLLSLQRAKLRRIGLGIVSLAAVAMLLFSINIYMPKITISWSQKGIWDAYYGMCTPSQGPPGHDAKKRYCKEQALSYKLNWRGETYYTQNEVIPIRNDKEFNHFLNVNDGKTFYAIMEYSRWNGDFKRKLPAHLKNKACAAYDENIKFVLVKTPCDDNPPKGK